MLHYRDLRERNVDLLLARLVDLKEDDVNAEILFEDRLYVVAGTNNPWTRRHKIALKDLANEPWVIPPPDYYPGALIVEALRASGLTTPHFAVTGYGVELQNALIATGRFLSVLPESFLRFSGKRLGLKALPVELPIQPRPVGIVTLRNRTVSPLAQLFIDCARNLSKPLAAVLTSRKR
jgi:DNA-binding transcriptional LysR family regulator